MPPPPSPSSYIEPCNNRSSFDSRVITGSSPLGPPIRWMMLRTSAPRVVASGAWGCWMRAPCSARVGQMRRHDLGGIGYGITVGLRRITAPTDRKKYYLRASAWSGAPMPRTATAFGRQFLDALLTAFLTPASLETSTEVLQDHADIGQAVERATAAMLPPVVDRRTLQAGPIDDRFRMPRYREPLGATVPASTAGRRASDGGSELSRPETMETPCVRGQNGRAGAGRRHRGSASQGR